MLRSLPGWFAGEALEVVRRSTGRLVGFVARVDCVVRSFMLLEGRRCCPGIAWLAVEGWRNGGIGSLLVYEAKRLACLLGKQVLTVKTYGGGDYKADEETLRFYLTRGFMLYEVLSYYEPFNNQPAAILVKPLECRNNP